MPAFGQEGAYAQETVEKVDLVYFRSHIGRICEDLYDLKEMMKKIANSAFGPRPENEENVKISTDKISEEITLNLLNKAESLLRDLRSECNRF